MDTEDIDKEKDGKQAYHIAYVVAWKYGKGQTDDIKKAYPLLFYDPDKTQHHKRKKSDIEEILGTVEIAHQKPVKGIGCGKDQRGTSEAKDPV